MAHAEGILIGLSENRAIDNALAGSHDEGSLWDVLCAREGRKRSEMILLLCILLKKFFRGRNATVTGNKAQDGSLRPAKSSAAILSRDR